MRYVTISNLKEGMELASMLYDNTLLPMIRPKTVLTAAQIQIINSKGYAGVYINDQYSGDVSPIDPIGEELRLNTIKSAKDLLQQVHNGGYENGYNVSKVLQEKIIMSVIEQVIKAPDRILDHIDVRPFDEYEYYHTASCVILSVLLGIELGLSGTKLYEIAFGALLHDVGNLFIPQKILSKPGKLTDEEYAEVKKHTEIGFDYMRKHFDVSVEACMGALHHHENFDGSGYPFGLKGNRISIYGRVISVVDVFDALISRRPYRSAMLPSTAIEYLESKAGKIFDPSIVRALRNVVAPYPAGTMVELNTGASCLVLQNSTKDTSRPKLRLSSIYTKIPMDFDLINDAQYKNLHIKFALDS